MIKPLSIRASLTKGVSSAIRSRLRLILVTILGWVAITGLLGTGMWLVHGRQFPWLVYVYNAFTVFSNLNDDLGLVFGRNAAGVICSVNIPAMTISALLILCGMTGIALFTAAITQRTLNTAEERFDHLVDEFRRLAVALTCPRSPDETPDIVHRALASIIARIHDDVMPSHTNTSVHPVNVYEFEYILVHVIHRVIVERRMLDDPPDCFRVYDLQVLTEVIAWSQGLDNLRDPLADPQASPISRSFRQAWQTFSVDLPARIQGTARTACGT